MNESKVAEIIRLLSLNGVINTDMLIDALADLISDVHREEDCDGWYEYPCPYHVGYDGVLENPRANREDFIRKAQRQ